MLKVYNEHLCRMYMLGMILWPMFYIGIYYRQSAMLPLFYSHFVYGRYTVLVVKVVYKDPM